MTSLSPEARSLIEQAQNTQSDEALGDARKARLKGRVLASIAATTAAGATALTAGQAAAASGATTASGASTATAASATTAATAAGAKVAVAKGTFLALGISTAAKAGALVLAATATVVGVSQVVSPPAPTATPTSTTAVAVPTAHTSRPPASIDRQESSQPTTNPSSTSTPAVEPPSTPAPAKATAEVGAPSASSLAAETDLLQRAQAELTGGSPERALEILNEHANSHGTGTLREEREAARVHALCAAGRVEAARAAAARFAAQFPRSPQRARVISACTKKR